MKTEAILVDGTFCKPDAKEVLLNLFNSKIAFHEAKNFSHEIRFNRPDEHAKKRAAALKIERDACISQLIELPEDSEVRLFCQVEIEAKSPSNLEVQTSGMLQANILE